MSATCTYPKRFPQRPYEAADLEPCGLPAVEFCPTTQSYVCRGHVGIGAGKHGVCSSPMEAQHG